MSRPAISLIAIILSLGFLFFYVIPEFSLMQKHRADLAVVSRTYDDAYNIKSLAGQTRQTLDAVSPGERARFSVFLPEAADTIRLANNLQHIGLKNGVVLENITVEKLKNVAQKSEAPSATGAVQGAVNIFAVGRKAELTNAKYESASSAGSEEVSPDKKYVTTKTSFTFTATNEVFGRFLFDIEKSLELMDIRALSFSPAPVSAGTEKGKSVTSPMYQYAVTVEIYSLK